jgi:hypothetical protein
MSLPTVSLVSISPLPYQSQYFMTNDEKYKDIKEKNPTFISIIEETLSYFIIPLKNIFCLLRLEHLLIRKENYFSIYDQITMPTYESELFQSFIYPLQQTLSQYRIDEKLTADTIIKIQEKISSLIETELKDAVADSMTFIDQMILSQKPNSKITAIYSTIRQSLFTIYHIYVSSIKVINMYSQNRKYEVGDYYIKQHQQLKITVISFLYDIIETKIQNENNKNSYQETTSQKTNMKRKHNSTYTYPSDYKPPQYNSSFSEEWNQDRFRRYREKYITKDPYYPAFGDYQERSYEYGVPRRITEEQRVQDKIKYLEDKTQYEEKYIQYKAEKELKRKVEKEKKKKDEYYNMKDKEAYIELLEDEEDFIKGMSKDV